MTEQTEQVEQAPKGTLLYSTEFGSRLYGTSTPKSDLDLKYVYVPSFETMIGGRAPKNSATSTKTGMGRNSADDVDTEWIPIQVFAKDFLDGQTYALELAFSIDGIHANQTFWYPPTSDGKQRPYQDDERLHPFHVFCRELRARYLTGNVKSMTGYAYNQARIYGVKGNRLASVEKVVKRLDEMTVGMTPDQMDKHRFVEHEWNWWLAENTDKYLFHTMYENSGKMYPAMSLLEKINPFNDITLTELRRRLDALTSKYGGRAQASKDAGGLDWKALSHALRITMQANQLLGDHELTFPFEPGEVELLLSIKHGEKTFEEYQAILDHEMSVLELLKDTTKLRSMTPELQNDFRTWLGRRLTVFYRDEMKKLISES